ncbi:hypothetical protein AMECASPLE_029279 [Ameca splendens]|uniref:Uncharacterized protein n=1 Tax=Ameca splendens TaxID=208324 RepID=A0ABV0ZEY5_9TELE
MLYPTGSNDYIALGDVRLQCSCSARETSSTNLNLKATQSFEVDLWLCFSRGDADGDPAPSIDCFDCDTDRFHPPLLLLLFTLRLELAIVI